MLLFLYSLVFTRIRKGIERNKKENLKSTHKKKFETKKEKLCLDAPLNSVASEYPQGEIG